MSDHDGRKAGLSAETDEMRAGLERALSGIARDNLRPIVTGLSVFFLSLAASHWLSLPHAAAPIMTATALATAAMFFCLRYILGKWPLPLRWTHPFGAGLVIVLLCNTLLRTYLLGDPIPSVMILIVAAGGLFISRAWLIGVLAVIFAATAVVAVLALRPSDWLAFGISLGTSAVLSILLHTVRVNALARLEKLRISLEEQKRSLQEALNASEREIRERRLAEAALYEAEQKYRSIFENAVEGIFQMAPDGRFLAVNPALAHILGYASPQALTDEVTDARKQLYADPTRYSELEQRLLGKSGFVRGFEVELMHRAGGRVWVSSHVRTVRDSSGALLYFEGISQDISERKRLEEELRLAQKMEAIGQLAGGIAHDFNNVLTGIIGYTQLLLSEEGAESRVGRELTQINALAERAATLTQRLLAFSRRQTLRPVLLDPNTLVESISRTLARFLGEGVELEVSLAPGLGHILADPGQIEQVLMNLLVNARDAMPDGGTVTIATANVTLSREPVGAEGAMAPGDYVLISVADTGHGIDRATQARIFEPFFTTKDVGKGTGLGLSTSYGVIRQHGGQILVESERGKGAVFRIYLPREEAPAAEIVAAVEQAPRSEESDVILVAEDEEVVRSLVRSVLERQGYRVLCAAGPVEAEALFGQADGKVGMLLTDFMMPVRNGRELYERLAARSPMLKVMFMSGYVDVASSPERLPGPFLAKPFTPTSLVAKVREVMASPA